MLKLSSRVQYAARAVYYLAAKYGGGVVSLHQISSDEKISVKFLENIMRQLVKAGILISKNGKNGGFALARPPAEITMNEVVAATEGALVSAGKVRNVEKCRKCAVCEIRNSWKSLGKVVTEHLESINFQDMIDRLKKGLEEEAGENLTI